MNYCVIPGVLTRCISSTKNRKFFR